MKNKLIADIENAQLKHDIPEFGPGDNLVVQVKSAKVRESGCRPMKALLLPSEIAVLTLHSRFEKSLMVSV